MTEINGIGGINGEEAIEIAKLSGKLKKVSIMSLSEFNPRIEDYRSGRMAVSIFYFFLMGLISHI